jgi:single-stranded DNA-binding protein
VPSSVNVVVLVGNLTRDPELRATAGGTSVCKIGLAVNERAKDPTTGEWGERPNYFDIDVFGAQAESCAQYLTKGRQVAIEGRLRWRSRSARPSASSPTPSSSSAPARAAVASMPAARVPCPASRPPARARRPTTISPRRATTTSLSKQ